MEGKSMAETYTMEDLKKRLQATVMLLKRLDIGVRPADGGLESLGAKEPYGL